MIEQQKNINKGINIVSSDNITILYGGHGFRQEDFAFVYPLIFKDPIIPSQGLLAENLAFNLGGG